MGRKQPLIYGTFNLYVNGSAWVMGITEATMPAREAKSETISGPGILGEIDAPVKGQYAAATLTLNLRAIYDDTLLALPVAGDAQRFDLRPALETKDIQDFSAHIAPERWSIVGPVKKIDPGKRGVASAADASIEVAAYRIEHYVDGKKVYETDYLNAIDTVGDTDYFAAIRAAIS